MEDKNELSESRITLDDNDFEDSEGEWPRPEQDIRAHLYKWILGLALLVALVIAAAFYLMNPFGESVRLATERVTSKQTASAKPASPKPPVVSGKAVPKTKAEQAPDTGKEPPVTYIPIQEEPEPPTVSFEQQAQRISPDMIPGKAEKTGSESTSTSRGKARETSVQATGRGSAAVSSKQAQPAKQGNEKKKSRKTEKAAVVGSVSTRTVHKGAKPPVKGKTPAGRKVRISAKFAEKIAKKTNPAHVKRFPPRTMWYIQLGVFRVKAHATQLKKQFERAGFPTIIQKSRTRSGALRYFARVGPYPSRNRADAIKKEIKKLGHNTILIKQTE